MEPSLVECLLNHKQIKLSATRAAHGLVLSVAQASGDAQLIIGNPGGAQTITGVLTVSGLTAPTVTLTQEAINPLETPSKGYVDTLFYTQDNKNSVRMATIAALPSNTLAANVLTGAGRANPTVLPGAAPSTTSGTIAIGTYLVCYTWVTAQGETARSPERSVTTTTNTSRITVSYPVRPAGVTTIKVYITEVGGASDTETFQFSSSSTGTSSTRSSIVTGGAVLPTTNTTYSALSTIDGLTPALNDRILVKNEATSLNNGIYTVTALGDAAAPVNASAPIAFVLTRAADADTTANVNSGMTTYIDDGVINGKTIWSLTTLDPITLNTSALVFEQPTLTAVDPDSVVGGIDIRMTTAGAWNRAFNFKHLNNSLGATNILGGFGALGGNGTLTYLYLGESAANPTLVSTITKRIGINTTTPTDSLHILGGGLLVDALGTAPQPAAATQGTAGVTSYSYYVVAVDAANGRTVPGVVRTITTGNAVLDVTNFNRITWAAVTGAVSYDILKTDTATKLGSVPATATRQLDDTGQATSAYTVATRNETADVTVDGRLAHTSGGYYFLDRQNNSSARIQWFNDTTYKAWIDYMSNPAGTVNGITPSTGTLVTSWARRSYIENVAAYGWIFESASSGSTTPAAVFEIRSSDGAWRSGGAGTITAGGLTITAGGLTVSAGAVTLPAASIADAALSSNVLLLAGAQTVTGLKTFSGGLTVSAGTVTLPAASIADAALSSNIMRLNLDQTYTAKTTFRASDTTKASFTVPHGAAPTAPVNGDFWTTTAAAFVRLNSVTATLAQLGAQTFTGLQTLSAGLTVSGGTVTLPAASVADAALSANVGLLTGAQTFSGLKTFSAGLTVSGGTLTLPAASIADAALSVNVPLKSADNTFSGNNTFSGQSYEPPTVLTASTTITTQQNIVTRPSPAATLVVTLPAAPTTGQIATIKGGNGNEAAYNVTVAGNGKTIDGFGSRVMTDDYGYMALRYNGTQWNVISATTNVAAAMGSPIVVTADASTGNATYTLPGSGQNEWVFKGGIPQYLTTDYTKANGKITFVGGNIPAGDEAVAISCSTATYTPNRTAPTRTGSATIGVEELVTFADATAGGFTLTLPTASSTAGDRFTIKKKDVTNNVIAVVGSGGELVEFATSYLLEYRGEFVTVISDGSSWYVVGE